jgi:hypothetical protein
MHIEASQRGRCAPVFPCTCLSLARSEKLAAEACVSLTAAPNACSDERAAQSRQQQCRAAPARDSHRTATAASTLACTHADLPPRCTRAQQPRYTRATGLKHRRARAALGMHSAGVARASRGRRAGVQAQNAKRVTPHFGQPGPKRAGRYVGNDPPGQLSAHQRSAATKSVRARAALRRAAAPPIPRVLGLAISPGRRRAASSRAASTSRPSHAGGGWWSGR